MKLNIPWLTSRARTKASEQRPAQVKQPEFAEAGIVGTAISGGYLSDPGEYNPALAGLAAFSTYERMRRSDGQVAATLLAMKLPIRSMEWRVIGPSDPTPIEREATEFIRQELLEEIEFDAVIENALLMLDFGCAAHEDVYYIDGNRVRLRKLAPRLPTTFERWLVNDQGELEGIEQLGSDVDAFRKATIPANKIALFTFQQEGNNFAGRSILRPMYQHWYIKSNLYKIDAIAQERNGMGIPTIIMGPNAKKEDSDAARAWLQKLATHEKASLQLPPDWEFKLVGVTGTTHDPKESIAHHNTMISMAALAQFMILGQGKSGNRALGETMSDFFYLGLEAVAKKIARVITWTTVARLVDFNFSGVERYPEIAPQKVTSYSFEGMMSALKSLASVGMLQPDDELEAWLRSQMGLPAAHRRGAGSETETGGWWVPGRNGGHWRPFC